MRDPQEFLQNLKIELYPEEVYIFTPKGEVKSLPRDATPVDFAYAIHTDVGHQCVGARVNGKMVPLRTRLRNGDIVEIVTDAGHKPSRDWLNFVVTSRARSKIKHFIHAEEKERSIELGRKLFDKEARRFGLNLKNLTEPETIAKVLAELGLSEAGRAVRGDRLREAVGEDGARELVPQEELKEAPESGIASVVRRVLGTGEEKISVRGIDDLMVFRARCCNPIRGEKIIGYITRGKGVSVHSAICSNVVNLLYDPERRIDVEWDKGADVSPYTVRLTHPGRGSQGHPRGRQREDRRDQHQHPQRRGDRRRPDGRIDMTVEISDVKHLQKVIKSLTAASTGSWTSSGRTVAREGNQGSGSGHSGSTENPGIVWMLLRAVVISPTAKRSRRFRSVASLGRRATWTVARAGAGVEK